MSCFYCGYKKNSDGEEIHSLGCPKLNPSNPKEKIEFEKGYDMGRERIECSRFDSPSLKMGWIKGMVTPKENSNRSLAV